MIILLSPAKTLDFSPSTQANFSQPIFLEESKQLVNILKKKSATDLKDLMKISDKIADLNVVRYRSFSPPFDLDNAKQAIFAFKGDVYTGLAADTLEEVDVAFAQQHVRILSGLYGLLKPLDLMQAYRLEMGTKLANKAGKNLYEFWDAKITKAINEELASSGSDWVINLASNEYFKSVQPKKLKANLLTISFKENRNGVYKIISFSAKKARGMMTRFIIQNKIERPEAIKGFDWDDYSFHETLSTPDHFVFTR